MNRHQSRSIPSGLRTLAMPFRLAWLYWTLLFQPGMAGQAADTFTLTNPLSTARLSHSATLLQNGKVLVACGYAGGSNFLNTAELYDPATGSWSPTGNSATPRAFHTATLLQNGKVLIVGGYNDIGMPLAAEIYDPASGTWSNAGNLATSRYYHTATLLQNGKVLVAGGQNQGGTSYSSAELYDPVANTWGSAHAMAGPRMLHTATLLPNGKVLAAAGAINGGSMSLTSTELYDPATDQWSTAGQLITLRSYHTAEFLPNGKVLVASGYNGSLLTSAELYDPELNTWGATGPLATARYDHTSTLLENGKVLVTGGYNSGTALASAQVYDPVTAAWTNTTASLITARGQHTATRLPNGTVLIAGGASGASIFSSAEIYCPPATLPTVTTPTVTGVTGTTATLGGNVTSDGGATITARGVVCTNGHQEINATTTGTTGVFTVNVSGLEPAYAYSFRAYATNSVGTSYSDPCNFTTMLPPDITVEQPAGTGIASGGAKSMGTTVIGTPVNLPFTITNPGASDLIGLSITVDGTNAADFTVTATPSSPLPSGGSTTFTVWFGPKGGNTSIRTAALHIANNVTGKNPYTINLTGQALSFTTDTDGDGMSDASEYNMAALGFDWQVSQPGLVNTYKSNANGAGYYSLPQVQSLNVGTPLLTRDPASGQFKLSIGIEKSTDLGNFTPFPFVAPQTSVNGQGRIEFQFSSPDNAAFYRLKVMAP